MSAMLRHQVLYRSLTGALKVYLLDTCKGQAMVTETNLSDPFSSADQLQLAGSHRVSSSITGIADGQR